MSESATPAPAADPTGHAHARPHNQSAPPAAAVPPPVAAAATSSPASKSSAATVASVSWRRWIALPFFFGALAFTLFAVVSTVTHTYSHPLTLLSRYFGTPLFGTLEYDATQTCEMSYFSLSHREVKLTELSRISQALVDGEIAFGDSATVKQTASAQTTRKEELDEEDAELAAAEEAEIAAARALRHASAATPTNASMAVLQEDFESFAALFRSALPAHLLTSKSKASSSPVALAYNARYRLMQYPHPGNLAEEQQQSSKKAKGALSNRVPILFVHGNGGSYHQMRSLASRLKGIYDTSPGGQKNDFFSVDFHEENSAFSGRLLWRQAWFVNEAIGRILSEYDETTHVVLICHSMGAVVCRSIYALGNLPRTTAATGSVPRVAMIGMLGGPQREPVLWTDSWMRRLYRVMNEGEKVEQQGRMVTDGDFTITQSTDLSTLPSGGCTHLHPLVNLNTSLLRSTTSAGRPFLLSVGGGERDFQIEMSRTDMEGLVHPEQHLSLAAHSLGYASVSSSGGIGAAVSKGGLASVDHQCLAWCSQIVETLAASVQEVATNLRAKTKLSESAMHAKQRAIWLPLSVEPLRKLAMQPVQTSSDVKQRAQERGIAVTAANKQTTLQSASGFVILDSHSRLAQLDSFVGFLRARAEGEGLLAVWNGRMTGIHLCVQEAQERCVDVTARATVVHPQLNPVHSSLSVEALESKRLGVASTYLLHLSAEQLIDLNLQPSQRLTVRLTPSAGAVQTLGKLRPMRGGRERIVVSARLVRGSDATVDGDHISADSGHSMRLVRWQKNIPAGLDYHADVRVTSNGAPALEADDIPLPSHIALFTLATPSSSNTSHLVLPRSTFSDQLHVFYPSSHKEQVRPLRVYRAKEDRVLVGVIVEVNGVWEENQGTQSTGGVTIGIHSHSFLSFLHTLYLQFSLLPQILLGTALCLFGVQFEYLRKYGRFPRMYELLELPAGGGGWREWTASSLMWSVAFLAVCFHLFFHGSLAGDTFLPFDTPFTPSASTGAAIMQQASILSGWSFRRGDAWELGVCGFILFAASVALCVILETVVYALLWSGSKVTQLTCGRCKNFAKVGASTPPAPAAASPAADGSSGEPVPPLTPQTRYLSFLSHRLALLLWIGCLLLSGAFTLCLCLYDLKYFLGMGLLDSMSFVGKELTAWASTICMVFGVIDQHFYFRDLTGFVERYAVLGKDLSVLGMTAGLIIFAIIMQMFTFPNTSSGVVSKLTEPKRNAVRSSAAYKSTGVVMILLISGVLLFPSILASLRLNVSSLTAAWEAAKTQQSAGGSASFFQPPPTKTTWDTVGTSGMGGGTGTEEVVLMYPFTLSVSGIHTMSLITLTWVTMFSWCLFHIPFSPPILQSCCITAYGLALLFFNGQSMLYYNLYWMAFMLCLCILPHTLASMMYLVHCTLDFAEGKIGDYDGKFEDEVRRMKQQIMTDEDNQKQGPKKKETSAPAAQRDVKKRR